MILRLSLIILTISAPLIGQSRGSPPPDTTQTGLQLISLTSFPIWTLSPATGLSVAPDTLVASLPLQISPTSLFLKRQRYLGFGLMVTCGALSYHYHQMAEQAYRAYRTSGNPAELDNLFERTRRLDRLAGWCYAGAETGLLMIVFSVVLVP